MLLCYNKVSIDIPSQVGHGDRLGCEQYSILRMRCCVQNGIRYDTASGQQRALFQCWLSCGTCLHSSLSQLHTPRHYIIGSMLHTERARHTQALFLVCPHSHTYTFLKSLKKVILLNLLSCAERHYEVFNRCTHTHTCNTCSPHIVTALSIHRPLYTHTTQMQTNCPPQKVTTSHYTHTDTHTSLN